MSSQDPHYLTGLAVSSDHRQRRHAELGISVRDEDAPFLHWTCD